MLRLSNNHKEAIQEMMSKREYATAIQALFDLYIEANRMRLSQKHSSVEGVISLIEIAAVERYLNELKNSLTAKA